MDQTGKKTNWKAIVAVVMVASLTFSFYKIAALSDAVETLQREHFSFQWDTGVVG